MKVMGNRYIVASIQYWGPEERDAAGVKWVRNGEGVFLFSAN